MFIICFVPAQILYLGKILFLICRPKHSQSIKLHISQWSISPWQVEQIWSRDSKFYCISRINLYFACWYKFMEVKISLKILGVGVVKNGCGQSYVGTPKLTRSEEWTNRIDWFFACWCRFLTVKCRSKIYWVGMVKNGCGHGTLKLTVSQNWADEITWFFASSTNAGMLKVESFIFERALSKMAVAF